MNWSDWLDDLWDEFLKMQPGDTELPTMKNIYLTQEVYNNPQDDDLGGFLNDMYNNGVSTKVAAEAMLNFEI
ncbi:MAG: hypothetical protein J6V44_14145 [Methanobrevibacter sp.]|nr:hypothetical protein [Methanobrevibacter sp.]